MALTRPPQHRLDSNMVYVHPSDDAWNTQLINDELAKMDDPSKHPMSRYFGGFTRYDLQAEAHVGDKLTSPAEYLDLSKHPCVWHLKRLSYSDWNEVFAMWQRSLSRDEPPLKAYELACRLGVKKVENGPELAGPPGQLTERDMATLDAYRLEFGINLIRDIGLAVFQANLPLNDAEKKHSAS